MVDQNNFEEGRFAAGYIRVSSAHPGIHVSIAAQKREIEKFAEANGIEAVDWYVEGEKVDEDSDEEDGVPHSALQRLLTQASTAWWCGRSPG